MQGQAWADVLIVVKDDCCASHDFISIVVDDLGTVELRKATSDAEQVLPIISALPQLLELKYAG